MTRLEALSALRTIPKVEKILKRASALSLHDSVYEIYCARFTLNGHARDAGIHEPTPYSLQESLWVSWIKVANPEATYTEIIEAYQLFEDLKQQYNRCTEEVTRQVGTKIPITTRASMVVEILHGKFPMFAVDTIEKYSWDYLISNR
ncbi:hypothetical protein [Neorhizobium sp. T25_27]|uniref:hypothetical protein n=1 Tax=Neorhizobium sp. T25_27 TaxID=2093831 RepID=UPI000CFA5F69|nr:hypothetical protein [Neorhizobium sp. T25_27]